MHKNDFSEDAFGDPFSLEHLKLPRPAAGYAVQLLDTDQLLDVKKGHFQPIRSAGLDPFFATFNEAHAAAGLWLKSHTGNPAPALSIVPVGYDIELQRPILIYGVLCTHP